MSKRLQVILDDSDYRALQKLARKQRVTVSEFVRGTLRATRDREPTGSAARKLAAVREATRHSFPTGDIDQMLSEIELGYQGRRAK